MHQLSIENEVMRMYGRRFEVLQSMGKAMCVWGLF